MNLLENFVSRIVSQSHIHELRFIQDEAPHFAFVFRAWLKTTSPNGGFVHREPVE